jgi:hypothetical protein
MKRSTASCLPALVLMTAMLIGCAPAATPVPPTTTPSPPTATPAPTSTPTPIPTATSTATPSGPSLPLSLDISADAGWVDTGVLVESGQSFTLTASGQVTLGKRFVDIDASKFSKTMCDKAGSERQANQRYTIDCLLTGAPLGAIVARVGDAKPFLFPGSIQFTPNTTGELFLGVNDCCVISDNSGSYLVTISTP